MRLLLIAAIAAAAVALSAFDAPRESGAYSSVPAQNTEACAQICAADTLCMAWTYAQNACALRATVPANMSLANAGLSARAPQSLIPRAPEPIPVAAPVPTPLAAPAAHEPETVETAMLLGGPDGDADSLRPAFGGSR